VKQEDKIKYLELKRKLDHGINDLRKADNKPTSWEMFKNEVEGANKWAENVLENNQQLLEQWRNDLPIDFDMELLDYIEDIFLKQAFYDKRHEDFFKFAIIHNALNVQNYAKDFLIMLKLAPEELKKNATDLHNAFSLGLNFSFGLTCEFSKSSNNLFLHAFHRALSSLLISEKRWGPIKAERKRKLEEIRVEAERIYKEGCRRPHHDVARWFHDKPEYKEKFGEIPLKEIRKVVGEVAEKYGCKSGMPKKDKF
jgi:hypothetical protein